MVPSAGHLQYYTVLSTQEVYVKFQGLGALKSSDGYKLLVCFSD